MENCLRKIIGAKLLVLLLAGCTASESELSARAGRTRFSAALTSYGSCATLESDLKAHFKEELRSRLVILKDQYRYGGGVALAEGDQTAGAPPPKVEGVDYSGTNVQEADVDESDFVKTDGNFIFVLNGKKLEILGVPAAGQLQYLSNLEIEGTPTQMLQFGNRIAVFSNIYEGGFDGPVFPLAQKIGIAYSRTKITIVNLGSDRKNPQTQKEVYFDGNVLSGRKIGSKIFVVSHFTPQVPGVIEYPSLDVNENFDWNDQDALQAAWEQAIRKAIANNNAVIEAAKLDDFVPHFYEIREKRLEKIGLSDTDCANFSAAQDSIARSFASILTVDLAAEDIGVEADHVLSNFPQVYASKTTLVLAEPAEEPWWFYANSDYDEATNLHRFTVSADGQTSYTGSGRIDGSILNQFSLSEKDGNLRVVATSGRFNRWFLASDQQQVSENHLYVLNGNNELNVVGQIDGIAKGERIWSSRFVGDKGYLVTFKNVDPLFTIDVSVPTKPRIVGELKVTGVSTYIHPLDGYLLNVGYGGNSDTLDWTTNLSVFNVTDFANPIRETELSFAPTSGNQNEGWMGAWSEANYEHKAITYWPPKKMLAIPVSTYRSSSSANLRGYWEYVSRLKLIRVELPDSLTVVGEVDHSDFFNSSRENFYNPDIRRSIFMGDYVYAISLKGVTAHRVNDLTRSAKVALRGI